MKWSEDHEIRVNLHFLHQTGTKRLPPVTTEWSRVVKTTKYRVHMMCNISFFMKLAEYHKTRVNLYFVNQTETKCTALMTKMWLRMLQMTVTRAHMMCEISKNKKSNCP